MKQKNIKGLISEYFIFLIFIALVVVLTCLKPSFIAPTNLVNILKQASINGILAFGMMFVIIAGGFDMSVGSTVAFTGILAALLGKGDLPLIVPLVVAMLAGLAVGMVNGIGVAIGDLPPFIMTLGSMTAVRGLALLTSNGKPITGISKEYKAVAASSIAGIPMLSVFACVALLLVATAVPALAADDPLTVVNNLSDFIFSLIRAIGLILLGFGILQVGLSLKSHDPSQRANGMLTVAGGIVITFTKEILSLITG